MMWTNKLSMLAARLIYGLFAVLMLGILVVWCRFAPPDSTLDFTAASIIAAVIVSIVLLIGRFLPRINIVLERTKPRVIICVLAAICFAIRLVVVLKYRVEPFSDYETFYRTAADLAAGDRLSLPRYIALFPHIFGYSYFLSFFLRIFGDGLMVAPLVNVALSTASMVLLFFICRRLVSTRAAVIAATLWTVFPSLSLYNIYALSEPLYTCELLGLFLLMIHIFDATHDALQTKPWRVTGLSVAAGILLLAVNVARPIAAVPFIAFAMMCLLVGLPCARRSLVLRGTAVLAMAAILFLGGKAVNRFIENHVGETPATTPGYSVYVGFNELSGGRWNADDSALLMRYSGEAGATAQSAQQNMLSEAVDRICGGDINFPKLLYHKLANLYVRDDVPLTSHGWEMFGEARSRLSNLSNAFYIAAVVLALIGSVALIIRKDRSPLVLFALYAIGLTMAQLLVEVAYRYHYSVLISLVVFASVGAEALQQKPERGER